MPRTEIKPDKSKIHLSKLDQNADRFSDKSGYEKRLKNLQEEMLHIQQTYWHEKRRAVLVFEGWDAAGKGGAIRRITEQLFYELHAPPKLLAGAHIPGIGLADNLERASVPQKEGIRAAIAELAQHEP